MSPIFQEEKFGALTKIVEAKFGAKPPPPQPQTVEVPPPGLDITFVVNKRLTAAKVKFLKYVSKIYALNFEIVAVTAMYQIFFIPIAFQSRNKAELDFCGFVIEIALNFKSQGNEKGKLSSQETYNFQNLRNETLIFADYKYVKIFRFAMLDIKLWLKDDNILHRSTRKLLSVEVLTIF